MRRPLSPGTVRVSTPASHDRPGPGTRRDGRCSGGPPRVEGIVPRPTPLGAGPAAVARETRPDGPPRRPLLLSGLAADPAQPGRETTRGGPVTPKGPPACHGLESSPSAHARGMHGRHPLRAPTTWTGRPASTLSARALA
jgi:hypothetical protein